MKKTVKLISLTLALLVFSFNLVELNLPIQVRAETTDTESIIRNIVTAIQEKDWNTYITYMSNEEQDFYNYYFNDDTYTDGIKQIETVELDSIISVSNDYAKSDLLTTDYPILGTSNKVQTYIVALDCTVNKENQYFYNGLNYFFIALAEENGQMRIVQFNKPTTVLMNKVVKPNIKKTDANYNKKKGALTALEYSEKGFLVNGNGELIGKGFELHKVSKTKEKSDGDATIESMAYSDTPNLDAYYYYTIPTYITCKLSNGTVVSPSLSDYVKNTINNEWYNSWLTESLKAGAYCIKGVAWYRSLRPVSVNYMVTQVTQKYIPSTSQSNTDSIIDGISNKYMINSDYCIFFPEYGAGTSGSAGIMASGRVLQWGTQFMAGNGFLASAIINYYYSRSCYSLNGDIVYITN